MKLNTHDRTPRIKNNNKFVIFMFCVCAFLFCLIFSIVAFCCIYYAKNVFAGVLVLLIPVLLTVWIFLSIKDLEKAYIEIKGNDIYVIDYYYGIKKEKYFLVSDITSAEILSGSSFKVKGLRIQHFSYIVFKNNKKYLFKIICLPETKDVFKKYL